MNLRIPSGRRPDDHAKWIVALRRVGMDWRIVAHCANTDLPRATLAAFGCQSQKLYALDGDGNKENVQRSEELRGLEHVSVE